MTIRFEDIKPLVGSRVVWDDRADLFTPEAAAFFASVPMTSSAS